MVPPSDPRLCPALEPSGPGDVMRGAPSWVTPRDGQEILFGDGSWRYCNVRMWSRDRAGRGVVQVEFYAAGATWVASYVADPAKMREPGV
jgi:hypothetical protein